ncbi:MAG: hypothetical protein Fur007_22530 [Rhodoferax sp.]
MFERELGTVCDHVCLPADFRTRALGTLDAHIGLVRELLLFLMSCADQGKAVNAYVAAAKGNALRNFAGVRPYLLPYVVDKNPAKQGQYMPGSRIPILAPEHLLAQKPNDVLILPWNLREEVMAEWGEAVRSWGGRFVTAVPGVEVT